MEWTACISAITILCNSLDLSCHQWLVLWDVNIFLYVLLFFSALDGLLTHDWCLQIRSDFALDSTTASPELIFRLLVRNPGLCFLEDVQVSLDTHVEISHRSQESDGNCSSAIAFRKLFGVCISSRINEFHIRFNRWLFSTGELCSSFFRSFCMSMSFLISVIIMFPILASTTFADFFRTRRERSASDFILSSKNYVVKVLSIVHFDFFWGVFFSLSLFFFLILRTFVCYHLNLIFLWLYL